MLSSKDNFVKLVTRNQLLFSASNAYQTGLILARVHVYMDEKKFPLSKSNEFFNKSLLF